MASSIVSIRQRSSYLGLTTRDADADPGEHIIHEYVIDMALSDKVSDEYTAMDIVRMTANSAFTLVPVGAVWLVRRGESLWDGRGRNGWRVIAELVVGEGRVDRFVGMFDSPGLALLADDFCMAGNFVVQVV